jgi:hypothetical protein
MRTKLLLGAFLMISLFGCKKPNTNDFQSTGIITGADSRMVACAGTWYIQIDNVIYEFDTLPAGSNVDLQNATFPIMVKLDWQLSTKPACPDKKIDILKIVKQ